MCGSMIAPNRNTFLRRRDLLTTALALPFAARPFSSAFAAPAAAQEKGQAKGQEGPEKPYAFEAASVRATARELALKPYKAPDNKLPDALKDLTYDRYRMIRFKPDHAWWKADGLPFQLQFFHRGFYYTNRVDIYEVKDGMAVPIAYSPD